MNWGDLGILMRRLRLRGVLSWRGLCSYCCLGCSCMWSLVVIWGWMDIMLWIILLGRINFMIFKLLNKKMSLVMRGDYWKWSSSRFIV